MNKLEVLYKVVKNVKCEEGISAVAKIHAFNSSKELVNMSNEFSKNKQTGILKAKLSGNVDVEGFAGKIDEDIELNMKELHEKHHAMHQGKCEGKGHGKNPMKKLSKAAFMLKALNEMNLVEEDGFKVIELNLNEMKKEIKEMKENHGKCEKPKFDCKEANEEMKKIFEIMALKHKIKKQIMCADYDKMTLKAYVDAEFKVKKLVIEGVGEQTLNAQIDIK